MAIFLKDPAATIDYAVDWQAAYLVGQSITAAEWIVDPEEPDGLVVTNTAQSDGRCVATLAGGQRGRVYRLTNRVTFDNGRNDDRSLNVRVEDR